ncbi:precorrin-6y C5,15-methyltransferase (decarboxylating) subunit CbiE [Celerinatantimonas sp. YJH-8]|uniref:precorrin-6y C5,15-methyltransferase (decarboxylating) subunit CbiE n=1 Tax=Celerinatantimonas sp. YJH-8 TaxID=3228714 RepID=UPI0038C29495
MSYPLHVIGVGEDGCLSLSSRAVDAVMSAQVLAGSERLLSWFPQFSGRRMALHGPVDVFLAALIEQAESTPVALLCSGDPLFFGLGRRLTQMRAAEQLRFIPALSSVQLACARLALPWDRCLMMSVHGRSFEALTSRLQQTDLAAVLTDPQLNPQALAQHLLDYSESHWQIHVCENLAATNESIRRFSVAELATVREPFASLSLVILQRQRAQLWGGQGLFASDEQFSKRPGLNGLITRAPVRHLAIAALRLNPDSCCWDIGGGSGSVAIEAAKQSYRGSVFCIESVAERQHDILANAQAHSTDNVQIVKALAPAGLDALPAPDAIFIGGSRGQLRAILEVCRRRLKAGGRLVVSAVTLETLTELYQYSREIWPASVQLVQCSHSVPVASYQRYQSENPIHLFCFQQPIDQGAGRD